MRGRLVFEGVWLIFAAWAGGTAARAEISREDRELVDRTWARLVAAAQPTPKLALAKSVTIIDDDTLNAYATIVQGEDAGPKAIAGVVVFRGLMEHVIKGSEDRLAFVLGHEFSHVDLGHLAQEQPARTGFPRLVFNRQQELDADRRGMIVMMKAGYSFKRGIEAYREFHDYVEAHPELRLKYSSFEGLLADHPAWTVRLAQLDGDRRTFWRAMSAFESGIYFLQSEQYVSAERCFEAVTEEFPQSDEAWTNYGHALLMQYCDKLEPADLKRLGIGQLVAGGFFRRAAVLVPVRGVDDQIWHDAVEALNKARQLKPGQTLANANLGIAYLVDPSLKSDVEQATKFLREAAAGQADETVKAAIAMNLGVAELRNGRREEAARLFEQARTAAGVIPSSTLTDAMLYNQAALLADSGDRKQRREALELLRRYLTNANSSSAWYRLAFDRYVALSREMGGTPAPLEEFAKPPALRPVSSITIAKGITIVLSEPLDGVLRRLDGGQKLPVSTETTLMRIRFPARGIDLLANDWVTAIILNGPNSPTLSLVTTAGQAAGTLHPGMSTGEVDRILRGVPSDRGPLDDPARDYRLYPDLGLALRVSRDVVEEVVIVQVPRQREGPR